jgi:hypothetical protein
LPEQSFGRDVAVLDLGDEGGSTHVALGFLIGFVSFDLGLTTVLSCLRI